MMHKQLKHMIDLGMISVRNPKMTLHNLRLFFKNRYQRMTRGWSDYDAYNIYSWFLSVFPDMLNHMRNNLHSTPVSVDIAEWESILIKMETCFRNSEIDNVDINDVANKDLNTYIQDNLDEGFKLFNDWFWDMWD